MQNMKCACKSPKKPWKQENPQLLSSNFNFFSKKKKTWQEKVTQEQLLKRKIKIEFE